MTDADRAQLALALFLWRALRGTFPIEPSDCWTAGTNLDVSDEALRLAKLVGADKELLRLILDRPLTQVTAQELVELEPKVVKKKAKKKWGRKAR